MIGRAHAIRASVVLLMCSSTAHAQSQSESPAQDRAPVHHHANIEGAGTPTVIFESGFGDTLDIWQTIQPGVAAHCARTFAYNRAGYLDSDPAVGSRDAATIVGELRDELLRRQLRPPYVLVGHSLGGLYMQYFARNYPAEVSGLVLIDSTHWQQGMKLDATANTPYESRTAVTLFMPLIMRQELADSGLAGREVNDSPKASKIPTIVLSGTRKAAHATPEDESLAVTLQNEIAADFPGSRHEFVENSGHYIQRDQPGKVIDAIRELAGCNHHVAGP